MKHRFETLDAFRGLAAVSVVLFHMHLVGSVTELDYFAGSFHFVDFFFVLSGFVLTHRYAFKKNVNFITFIKSRFFRLYPLHLFMLIVFILFQIVKMIAYKYGGFHFSDLPFEGNNPISEIIPNLLLIQAWDSAKLFSFNAPSWSVSIEFYLYILFFLTTTFFSEFKKIIWTAISLISMYLILIDSNFLNMSILRGLTCFFSGSLTYIIYKKISHNKPVGLLPSGFEFILIWLVITTVQYDFKYHYVYQTILFCMVVLFFSFESGVLSNFLKLKPFQILGKLSYSIYMTHFAIIFCYISIGRFLTKITGIEFTPMVNETRFLNVGNSTINNLIVLVIISVIFLISQFTYKKIELRWQEIGRKSGQK